MILGEYLFKRKIRNLMGKSRLRKHRFCSLEDARSVLVLYRNEDRGILETQLKNLQLSKKQVCCCVSCSGVVAHPDSSEIYIDKGKEADKYGVPKAELSDRIAKIPADILIDLSRGEMSYLEGAYASTSFRF